jgi:D-beta-D-heptose 7-phosphate kinase/D-beta-D-heptose 1-phosphate adenosyltransferase
MKKILVVGELCEDIFVYGDVKRICPEAPVPVFNPTHRTVNKGMGGNVVENLKSLDSTADIVHWHQETIITKTRMVETKSNQMMLRIDEGENVEIQPMIFLSPKKNSTIKESDVIIISDYDKGFVKNELIKKLSELHPLVVLDTKKKLDIETIKNVKFIKLNEIEYLNNLKLVHENPEKFIITLGPKGCRYNNVDYPSPKPKDTIDVSGAGDTFISSFTLKYLETKNIEKSLQFANEMASIVVSQRGVTTPNK